jgi:prolipoprotein diacylglyceryl transferase
VIAALAPTAGFLPSPPSNGFYVGPLFVHAYGLAYVVAVIAAVAIAVRRWEAQGGSRELVYDVALWAFPAGIVGGRLYFIATSWSEVPPHWWGVLAVWDGGLGIWGGVAAGAFVGIWVLRRHGANVPLFMDAVAPALLVAQAIGRVGNYFNQELFGGPTTLPWGLEILPAHRPVGYVQYATFQPTFLYELIWNLLLAAALVWLGRHRKIRAPGLFALYVAGYSLARIGEELMRIDPAHRILGLRLNFYVASIVCLAGIAWFVRIQRGGGTAWLSGTAVRRGGALLAAGGVLALAGCGQSSRASAYAGGRYTDSQANRLVVADWVCSISGSASSADRVAPVQESRYRPSPLRACVCASSALSDASV